MKPGIRIWNAMSIFPGWSAVMNERVPRKFCLYDSIGTSVFGTGTLKRVAETMYFVSGDRKSTRLNSSH